MLIPAISFSGQAHVLEVESDCQASQCDFTVTVQHADTGWEHYADSWQVMTLEGEVLGERVLYHPHVDEQPFTRSLSGIAIPLEIDRVNVRAHDSQHGFGGTQVTVTLAR